LEEPFLEDLYSTERGGRHGSIVLC
jgi:hypothetical protein